MSKWHDRTDSIGRRALGTIMASRLNGIQPWYEVPSSLSTVDLSRYGALHARNNGFPLLRLMRGCGQGAFVFFFFGNSQGK